MQWKKKQSVIDLVKIIYTVPLSWQQVWAFRSNMCWQKKAACSLKKQLSPQKKLTTSSAIQRNRRLRPSPSHHKDPFSLTKTQYYVPPQTRKTSSPKPSFRWWRYTLRHQTRQRQSLPNNPTLPRRKALYQITMAFYAHLQSIW